MTTPQPSVPVLGIAAFSGTGKTTLLERVLPLLNEHGLRVGMVKASHHIIDPDQPGKDSYRLRQAGAQQMVLSTPQRSITYTDYPADHERSLDEQLQLLDHSHLDLVLVEGFRDAAIPKIELHRHGYTQHYLYPNDSHVIAVARDAGCTETLPDHLDELDLNDAQAVAWYIHLFVKNHQETHS